MQINNPLTKTVHANWNNNNNNTTDQSQKIKQFDKTTAVLAAATSATAASGQITSQIALKTISVRVNVKACLSVCLSDCLGHGHDQIGRCKSHVCNHCRSVCLSVGWSVWHVVNIHNTATANNCSNGRRTSRTTLCILNTASHSDVMVVVVFEWLDVGQWLHLAKRIQDYWRGEDILGANYLKFNVAKDEWLQF